MHITEYTAGNLQDSGINAELGVSASDDAMLDSLADKAEREILSGGSDEKNLLGYCAGFLSKLCRNFSLMQKVSSSILRSVITAKIFHGKQIYGSYNKEI